MPSKFFLDLQVCLAKSLLVGNVLPSTELTLETSQTGVIFNDTDSGTGTNVITTELHPESSGSEQAEYTRALQQLILDVSNTARPPAGYERPCNPAHPQLESTVEYLQKALATVKAD